MLLIQTIKISLLYRVTGCSGFTPCLFSEVSAAAPNKFKVYSGFFLLLLVGISLKKESIISILLNSLGMIWNNIKAQTKTGQTEIESFWLIFGELALYSGYLWWFVAGLPSGPVWRWQTPSRQTWHHSRPKAAASSRSARWGDPEKEKEVKHPNRLRRSFAQR